MKYSNFSQLNIQQISHFEFIHLNQTISSQIFSTFQYLNHNQRKLFYKKHVKINYITIYETSSPYFRTIHLNI